MTRLAFSRLRARPEDRALLWAVLPCAVLLCAAGAPGTAGAAAADVRDPMRPPAAPQSQRLPAASAVQAAPVLSAVMGAEGSRSAIFNGHLVHAGGAVGGYAILAVLVDGVRYRYAGVIHEMHLASGIAIKQPTMAPARVPNGAP